ncbi:AMP-binding protein [Nocardia brasiliensis]|uniref:Carboxylic acid reductase n=1 Tax=Nocardia brasiliensis TaxID=37326 RepID=A0A6G9XS88_NOCBR|nr:carboxylic acid reductase [Nocardia brasiliensis]QIS03777.1 AMP-binding protein [Nocardia brasiliensis]
MTDVEVARRIEDLCATDEALAGALPDPAVTARIQDPALGLADLIRVVFDAYADRPAVGARATRLVADPVTGRTTPHVLPEFETLTYAELGRAVAAVAAGLRGEWIGPGEHVAMLGFTSIEYTVLDLAATLAGAVAVPMQSNAPAAQLKPIVAETRPGVLAAGVDQLDEIIDLAQGEHRPDLIVVLDHRAEVDAHREAFEAASARLAESGIALKTLAELADSGREAAVPATDTDAERIVLLIYTSGSTGTPKGAMYSERLVANLWQGRFGLGEGAHSAGPWITLNFMPMSHLMGRYTLYGTLAHGGIAYFAASSDLSTFLEDLALSRPTQLQFVPRVWDLLYQEYRRTLDSTGAAERAPELLAELRRDLLGGRVLGAVTGSAPISVEVREFVDALLGFHLPDGYGSTEAGGITVDGKVVRPPVLDYKLADVPELGYYSTDRPHPRGELLVKTENIFPGYYRRPEVTAEVFDPEGYYRTGDIVAEVAPDELRYLDRRNNVLKLSQGEFVTVSKLEAAFGASPLIQQIYVYGNSARPYLLAVIVPDDEVLQRVSGDLRALGPVLAEALRAVAADAGLQSYEIPRDFLIETTPFTVENGLLTGIRKLARPKLRQRYGEELEQLYQRLADGQAEELRALRAGAADRPVLETVIRAAAALLGIAVADVRPTAHFTELGGDSLSALTFGNALHDILGVEVPVGVIVSPATDLRALAGFLESGAQATRPTFASVHGADATEVHAADLTLEKFLDTATLDGAASLPAPNYSVRTVLLTGATGFLGRFLALSLLERLVPVDGTLICLVRATDDAAARARLDRVFDSGDPQLLAHYERLAERHLEVLAGDKGELDLGLDPVVWQGLAERVDLIVDCAALVNHVLPYSQLFGPNVVGTAELIKLALTGKQKIFDYISTVGVGDQIALGQFVEDADVRTMSATRSVDDRYANGYGNSKWAGEVLLREANERFGLPVSVFRCDMIMVDGSYVGQLNVPDMFTRLMLSLVATGIAPGSFYQTDAAGQRQRAHYDGLPVDFIAEAVAELGVHEGFSTYHVMNPHHDGIGLDEFVDWLVAAGYPITRVADYQTWLEQFGTKLRALPESQRKHSLLPLLHSYAHPQPPTEGGVAPADLFRAAVQEANIGPDKDIPHLTEATILKYITNLEHLGLL